MTSSQDNTTDLTPPLPPPGQRGEWLGCIIVAAVAVWVAVGFVVGWAVTR